MDVYHNDSHVILSYYHRTPVDRDYKKITEQNCSQVLTHYGVTNCKFGSLTDVATGPNNEVVIVDSGNNCVVVLDDKLNFLNVIGQGSGNSKLVKPDGVAVTNNFIAVTDYGSNEVKKYTLQGDLNSVFGGYGERDGEFSKPRGLAFNSKNMLYVVDKGNCRVQAFKQNNEFAFSFGNRGSGPVELVLPIVIAFDSDNNAFVSNYKPNCIYKFSCLGGYIQTIDCGDNLNAYVVSPTGYLISGHRGDDRKIRVWNPVYKLIKEFGKKGSEQGEFDGIMGIAMSSTGTIYVVEWGNRQLQVFTTN